MKKLIMMLALLAVALSYSTDANAQLLKKLGERVKNTVENKVLNKAEDTVSDEMDDALGNKKSNKNNNANDAEEAEAVASDEPVDFAEIQAKSDFKRGSTVFFEDNVSGEQMGEFPSKWDLLEGSQVEVVNIAGRKAIKMEASRIQPLMDEKEYLPEEFMQLDIYVTVFSIFIFIMYFGLAELRWKASLGKYLLKGILLDSDKIIIKGTDAKRMFTRLGLYIGYALIFHFQMGLGYFPVIILYIILMSLPILFTKQSLLDLMTGTIYAKRK